MPEGKKKSCGRIFSTLKFQMTVTYVVLMIVTFAGCWFFNHYLLERNYLEYKRENLIEVYNRLFLANENGEFGEEAFESEILSLCNNYNVSFVVTDASSNTIYSNIILNIFQ